MGSNLGSCNSLVAVDVIAAACKNLDPALQWKIVQAAPKILFILRDKLYQKYKHILYNSQVYEIVEGDEKQREEEFIFAVKKCTRISLKKGQVKIQMIVSLASLIISKVILFGRIL